MTKNNRICTTLPKEKCFGCTLCIHICDQGALQMQEDAEGFLYPAVNKNLCTACGQCYVHCPSMQEEKPLHTPMAYYACQHKEQQLLEKSSSGGVFPAIAKAILNEGGYVCAAGWEYSAQGPAVSHRIIHELHDIALLQGSKYVQSRLANSFAEIIQLLHKKTVLFCGTPCQVAGLQQLTHAHPHVSRLYCLEVICYGVASPKCFTKYAQSLGFVTEFSFRERVHEKGNRFVSYTCNDNKTIIPHAHSPFMLSFFKNLILRPVCHHCPYTHVERGADISMGDLHNTQNPAADFNLSQGASSIFINTEKGRLLWQSVQDNFCAISMTAQDSKQARTLSPTEKSPQRQDFMAEMDTLPFTELVKKFTSSLSQKQQMLQQLRARRGK